MTDISIAWWVHEAIQDSKTWQFGVSAGLGSGKTHGSYQWSDRRVRDNVGCRFIGDLWPTYQKIHDAGIPTYEKVLNAQGMQRGLDYKIIKSPFPKLIYLDQQPNLEVHFLSAENPDKIIAVEYAIGLEHESGIITAEASRNLRSRVRDPQARIRQVLREGVPQGVNDFAADFDSDTLPGWDKTVRRDHKFRGELEKRRFTVWTDDNPFVPSDYIQLIQDTYGHNQNLIRSYRYGEFCPLVEGAAYSNYFPQKHDLDKDIEADPYLDIEFTWDFNANPLAWVTLQCLTFREFDKRILRWVGIHEANQGANTLDEAVIEFAAKHPVERFSDTTIIVGGDSSGHAKSHKVSGSDYDNIRKLLYALGYKRVEIKAAKHNPLETESVEALQSGFLRNTINLCPRLRLLRKSLMATCWKPNVRKLDKPPEDTWTHHSDALKYFAYRVLRNFSNTPSRTIHGVNI